MCPIDAIEYPTCQPAMRIVTAITNAFPAQVTTSFAHNFEDLLVVRFYIPPDYGMAQLNLKEGKIEYIDATHFNVYIDTTLFDPFVVPGASNQKAQVVPVGVYGSGAEELENATRNVLPY